MIWSKTTFYHWDEMTIERNDQIPFIHITSLLLMYKKYGAYNCTTNLSSRSLSYIEDPNSGIKKISSILCFKRIQKITPRWQSICRFIFMLQFTLTYPRNHYDIKFSLLYYFMLNIPPLICMSLNKNTVYCILSRS